MSGAIGQFITHMFPKNRGRRGNSLDNSFGFDGLATSVWTRMADKSDECTDTLDDDSDKSSIDSFSTMSTMDNNPGTGRILDTYIYQNLAKIVEKWINRMKLPYLPPETVLRHIIKMSNISGYDMLDHLEQYSIEATSEFLSDPDVPFGNDIVYGLNTLVSRANSNSISERAIALTALLYLSSHNPLLFSIFSETARTHPNMLRQPKMRVGDPQNDALQILYKVANMTCRLWERLVPSLDLARSVRSRLINRLGARRYCDTRSSTLDDICCATGLLVDSVRCIAFLDWVEWGNPAVIEVVEAAFYVMVFLVHSFRSTSSITRGTSGAGENTRPSENQHLSIFLLSTQLHNFQQLSRLLIWKQMQQGGMRTAELTRLGLTIASLFRGGDRSIMFSSVHQEAYIFRSSILMCFPRSIRRICNDQAGGMRSDNVFQYVCTEADKRVDHLLQSLVSLEKEITRSHTTSKANHSALQRDVQRWLKTNKDPLGPKTKLWKSLKHARRVAVDLNILTEEFRQAREFEEDESEGNWPMRWRRFQELCEARRSWGMALQMAPFLGWESHKKISQSLRRLFMPKAGNPCVHTRVPMGGSGDNVTVLLAEITVDRIPKEMRLRIKSQETGETAEKLVSIEHP